MTVRKDVTNKETLMNCIDTGNISKLSYMLGLSQLVRIQKGFS